MRFRRSGQRRPTKPKASPGPPSELEQAVRKDLAAAGQVGSFYGQLALTLAQRLADPDESSVSSLSKELRAAMAAALAGSAVPDPDETDEVAQARAARELKRLGLGRPEDS